MNTDQERVELREELLDELETCVQLQLILILVPVRRLLLGINQEELYNAIDGITANVRERLGGILESYAVRTIDSYEYKIARMMETLSQDKFFGKITIGLQNGKITSIKKEESLRLQEI